MDEVKERVLKRLQVLSGKIKPNKSTEERINAVRESLYEFANRMVSAVISDPKEIEDEEDYTNVFSIIEDMVISIQTLSDAACAGVLLQCAESKDACKPTSDSVDITTNEIYDDMTAKLSKLTLDDSTYDKHAAKQVADSLQAMARLYRQS